MIQLLAVALATLIYDTHYHALGAREGTASSDRGATSRNLAPFTATAFQFPYCKYYSRKKPSASFELRYSSDEGGIQNFLHPKHSFFSDKLDIDREDHFVVSRRDRGKDDGDIIDNFTNDTKERRRRRLQSLENFNKANGKRSDTREKKDLEKRASGNNSAKLPMGSNLELPYNDLSQLQAIQSNAPAILLPSGPGTGKSHVLSLRIAYLLQNHFARERNGEIENIGGTGDIITPDSMVILSFTNRDAERLKQCALDRLFPQSDVEYNSQILRNETSQQLWAGTMHAFSLSILRNYGSLSSPLRVLHAREMRNRVSASLRSLLNIQAGEGPRTKNREIQSRHLQALNDVGHSRFNLQQNIVRCIDLWKEANMPLQKNEYGAYISHPPEPTMGHSVEGESDGDLLVEENVHHHENQQREARVRKACTKLAVRLGIPESSALLALDIYPEYQARHAAAGTADLSDLAGMAYRLLVDQHEALHLLRSKLKHIIVDEYQDMSVSQHALLRLVVRGSINKDGVRMSSAMRKKRIAEKRRRRKLPVLLEPSDHQYKIKASPRSHTITRQSYSVPSIFCAGDASQSIYGWRGGAPELTVRGFRQDYPQGIIAPLDTCYRLPNDIVDAASMLLPMGSDGEEDFWDAGVSDSLSYDVSPAAAAKVASSINDSFASNVDANSGHPRQFEDASHHSTEVNVRLGNRLLLSKGMQKLDSTVTIRGLWDSREEAKYIASTIRRRSKERRKVLISALSNLDDEASFSLDKELLDLTDVAVMVRSSIQLQLIQEALENAGIPFISDTNKQKDGRKKEEGEVQNWLSQKRARQVKNIPMKPAKVMTMHRSKGEEFDDVYLAGWTEGEFPHPEAVSSNRVFEERRLAYVALTRARQRVVITHSFMKRVLHYGRDGRKKYVTGQVQPSRFLYELVPSKRIEDGYASGNGKVSDSQWLPSSDNKGTVWNRSAGVKEMIVGQNAPHFFQKAYQQPEGYVAKKSDLRQVTNVSQRTREKQANTDLSPRKPERREKIARKTPLQIIEDALKEIVVLREKGASKKYRPVFKEMLASFFQLRRGNAPVFASGAKSKQTQNESVYALVEASADELVRKPLGKCTATQLGHYLGYLILKPELSAPTVKPKVASTDACKSSLPKPNSSHEESLEIIEDALKDIVVLRKKGASKYYRPVFKALLAALFQLRRGNALVFASGAKSKQTQNESVYALAQASADELVKKPLGKCTAIQLGHYLAYLILKP